jgi:hypothetical protein
MWTDDLPPALAAAADALPPRAHRARQVRAAELLLDQLSDLDAVVATLADRWAPTAVGDTGADLRAWLAEHEPRSPLGRAVDGAAWADGPGQLALNRIAARALAAWVAGIADLDWATLDAAASVAHPELHIFRDALGHHARTDRDVAARLNAALVQAPSEPERWVFGAGRGELPSLVARWRERLGAGRLDVEDPFLPTRHEDAVVLGLLWWLDKDAFLDVVEKLPLPQVVEDVVSAAARTSDGLTDLLDSAPVVDAPAVHPTVVVALHHALRRVSEARGLMPQWKEIPDALRDQHRTWRDSWIAKVRDHLSHRDDGERLLPTLVAQCLDEAVRVDGATRRDQQAAEDAWAIVLTLAKGMDDLGRPLEVPDGFRSLDGRLGAWLLRVLLDEQDQLSNEEADALWNELTPWLSDLPHGLYWAVTEGEIFSRNLVGSPAGVLMDTSDPADAWSRAWSQLAEWLALVRRDTDKLYDVKEVVSYVLVVGVLATWGLVDRADGKWTEAARELLGAVLTGIRQMRLLVPFPDHDGLGIPLLTVLHLLHMKPGAQDLLTPVAAHAAQDPSDIATLAQAAVHAGWSAEAVEDLFGARVDVAGAVEVTAGRTKAGRHRDAWEATRNAFSGEH